MGCRCKQITLKINVIEVLYGVDHDKVRIKIEDSIKGFGKKVRGENPVIHFFGITACSRGLTQPIIGNFNVDNRTYVRMNMIFNPCEVFLGHRSMGNVNGEPDSRI
ncbi:hypothetical protein SDC9_179695 [bioreactor metagenome]|uniref:Uncharacterized protein n=1 Tax=bioreactor metagenome TaxID=1076179 RepID=A0A645H2K8_9ZZZZ